MVEKAAGDEKRKTVIVVGRDFASRVRRVVGERERDSVVGWHGLYAGGENGTWFEFEIDVGSWSSVLARACEPVYRSWFAVAEPQ